MVGESFAQPSGNSVWRQVTWTSEEKPSQLPATSGVTMQLVECALDDFGFIEQGSRIRHRHTPMMKTGSRAQPFITTRFLREIAVVSYNGTPCATLTLQSAGWKSCS